MRVVWTMVFVKLGVRGVGYSVDKEDPRRGDDINCADTRDGTFFFDVVIEQGTSVARFVFKT